MVSRYSIYVCIIFVVLSCQIPSKTEDLPDTWSAIEEQAKGSTVTMMMWQGDPQINSYMRDYIAAKCKEKYNIDLTFANGQGSAIVQFLLAERQAAVQESMMDIVWINGETFYQLRQLDALYGPFLSRLPNATYIDLENPYIGIDFQQDINGMECPWGNVQMTWIYHPDLVDSLPQTRQELYEFVRANPGKFTWDTHFTGMTLLKSWLVDIAKPNSIHGPYSQATYENVSSKLFAYIDSLRPYLWREGVTFPTSVASMHQLFANKELAFTFSNNDAEVDNKIHRAVFPSTTRAYVPQIGSIQNSHYLGIPKTSPNKAAAMVVLNEMISPEAQWRKASPLIWGDGTVLDLDRLPDSIQRKWRNIPGKRYAPDKEKINKHAIQELAPDYMIHLYDDFKSYVQQ